MGYLLIRTPSMSLEVLLTRRSVPSRLLIDPAPDAAQLDALLRAAIRVPDHGKLEPFRLLLVRGAARAALGVTLAEIHERNDPDLPPQMLDKDRNRFQAPLNVIVVGKLNAAHKVPVLEQQLSAGCVAYNLLIGAQQLGFGAQWLTGWAAYDLEVAGVLGLAEHEQIIGIIAIGTASAEAAEQRRPQLGSLLSEWTP